MTSQVWEQFMSALQEDSPSFSRRPSQEALVHAIVETLGEEGHSYLVAKAGTGTGKSLASVVPALGHIRNNRAERRPVIISTASKNLQGQYFLKDLPEMAEHFPFVGGKEGFQYAVLKGKSNYLCQARLYSSEAETYMSKSRLRDLRALAAEAPGGELGDLAMLPIQLGFKEARAVTISTEQCPGASRCPVLNKDTDCFYERAKERARTSEVVVINHALLALDAKVRARTGGNVSLLPEPGVLVIDECHKFSGYVQNALSWHVSRDFLYTFANEVFEDPDSLEEFKKESESLFDLIPHRRDKEQQHIVPRKVLFNNTHLRSLIGLANEGAKYWLEIAMEAGDPNYWRNYRRLANLAIDLAVAFNCTPNDNFWTELDQMGRPVLYYKPKEVAEFLSKNLWGQVPKAILMSATPGRVDLGLPETTTSNFATPSPFNYRENCRIYIPQSISGEEPRDEHDNERWLKRRNETIFKLVEASQGRALLLFTSWKDLNRTYDAMAPKMSKYVTVLRQTKDNEVERDGLAKRFKSDEHSVLFGTESFFEGVDVPGRALQLVVIAKLPFPSMMDATRGGKLDFIKEMMPEMRLKLEQAAGRLIRSVNDRGLIAVLDNRLLTKGYGKSILSQMPPFRQAPILTELADAVAYLEELDGDNE